MPDLSKPTNYVLPMPTGNNASMLFAGSQQDVLRFDGYPDGRMVVRISGSTLEKAHARSMSAAEEQELLAFLLMRHAYRAARDG